MHDDDSVAAISNSDSITTADLQEPILVGYAFGPKKMSTMATVMAEASRTRVIGVVEAGEEDVPERKSHALTSAALCLHQEKEARRAGGDSSQQGGLNNIVRYFRSSCSSVGSDEPCTNTSTTGSFAVTRKTSSSYTSGPSYPVRVSVSFVPLDLNEPLEEQHGGNFDIILHKMTEDILRLSTADSRWKDILLEDDVIGKLVGCEQNLRHAIERIHRLTKYQRVHPRSCLADNPDRVEVVMSRSAISSKLQEALVGVTSRSGLAVETPRFVKFEDPEQQHFLCYPLIAKPISAAGTKRSHYLGIVVNPSGLSRVKVPCIIQEYANHNATLFKVYVLGDDIHVFARPSLPNLPTLPAALQDLHPYVEFDSQRPYPKLDDFGIKEAPPLNRAKTMNLTVEEVTPVVEALKRAFGLQLFGFDILLSSGEMLVVDVNYFPSFKEVPNFPSLLARFLVQRAVQKRKNVARRNHDY